jgi:chromosome segregation ATPase
MQEKAAKESDSFRDELVRVSSENSKTISMLKTQSEDEMTVLKETLSRLESENKTYVTAIRDLKSEFAAKRDELEGVLKDTREQSKAKDEMIGEADTLLTEFNQEKHEVKAKFKHLMQLMGAKASLDDSQNTDE